MDGWSAINLETPPVVPRTEYSAAEYHFPLIKAVTGIDVRGSSSPEDKDTARRAFREAWGFSFNWSVLINSQPFGDYHTSMGHAVYAEDGGDLRADMRCPFETPEQALAFDPFESYGTVDRAQAICDFEEHYRQNAAALSNEVNMTGVYTTLISGLIEIFGWDMLLTACGADPEGFGAVAGRYAAWMQQYMDALADSDVPCVMIHDDIVWTSGAFLHPEWYRKYVFPHYKRYFAPILESGKKLIFTSDGDYTEFIDDIAAAGVNGFAMEPLTDMAYIADKYGRTHSFIGNADTRILLHGDRESIEAEVRRCMDIGKKCPGFIMAVGNHIPANTPVESCLIYDEAYRKMARR